MTRKWKIALYYIGMFLLMCTLIFLIELKSEIDVNNSYEKSSYAGYEKYVSVPKNLEVLGRGEKANYFVTVYETLTDQLLMVLFLIISTIPLAIYYSAKYIEKLDMETNELIDISNNEYLEIKEGSKEKVNADHKALFNDGYLSYKQGMFCGMLSDHLKMRDIYIEFNNDRNNAIVFEQDINNVNYISKILKGISYQGESIVVVDKNDLIYNETQELMNSYGYDVKKIDLCDDNKNKLKKLSKQNKLNLLNYFDSENEIISLANIISQGNSHLTKIISALLFVVKNDTSIDNPSMSDVYKLACEGLDKVSQKVKFVKEAYNIFNELILLDNKTKQIILDEAKEDLEIFNTNMFDFTNGVDKRDNLLKIEDVKTKSVIYYINIDELKTPYPLVNSILEAIFNICKNSYIEDNKSANRKTYIVSPSLNEYPKYAHLSDRLKDSKKYGLSYIIGLTNVKQFKDKYEFDADKIIENVDIKIFYAVRQYETTRALKQLLDHHSIDEVANIINSLDTNKCIAIAKDYDYLVLNIDEPNGEKYDKYSYGEAKDENAIDKIKNKDVKLKVNYLDEFKDRITGGKKNKFTYQDNKKQEEKEKALNLKPELTKEEREYIATLLKEKQEQDQNKYEFEYEEIDELADGDVDNKPNSIIRSLNSLYDETEKVRDDMDFVLMDGYDSSKEIVDEREVARHREERREAISNQKILRSEKDINDSLEKLNEVQNKIEELINEEKKKTTHALYEQMKKLK
ncbi:MAG: type IV secretory system conjugative DNA transfer family protein [Clostridia bacterium]|nr:type IV secretory system conjugative DNA transfer family protein [Clostridia bacterium]